MSVQVLITSMNNRSEELLKKMNISSNAMIGNQTDFNHIESFTYNGFNIKVFSFNERGVGLNRNNLLMRADHDYLLIADDDLVFVNNYSDIVEEQFNNNPDVDVIIFNLIEEKTTKYIIKKKFKVNYFNFMRFGAARLALKRDKIQSRGIFFNTTFGGGTKYSAGEDTLFLYDCLKKGLKIIAIPISIAKLTNERDSTWFKGYNTKYFSDKGTLFKVMSPKFAKLLCMQDAIRHRNRYKAYGNWKKVYNTMCLGLLNE